jgi:3alpha(or 20beta)-hydroxysteroid dehydrogenase
MEFFSLRDKVAVVTGGGSGIGLATARRFITAGARVIIANRSDSSALAATFGASYVRTDVSKEEDVQHLMRSAVDKYGRIDVLVNNAGFGQIGPTAADITTQTLNEHLQPNLLGVAYGVKHAVAYMPRGSSIINVSSIAGIVGIPTYGAYVASKFAVIGLTKTAAIELAPQGIRVNCVCPGTIDTPINQKGGADAELELVKALAPLGRIGQPEEVAALIHFLAAPDCGYLTGEAIVVDGGWLAGPSIAVFERLAVSPAQ